MRATWAVLSVGIVASSGCLTAFQDLVQPADQTTRAFACAMLAGEPYSTARILVLVDPDVDYSPVAPAGHLREVLADRTAKDRDAIRVHIEVLEETPAEGWMEEAWQQVVRRHRFQDGASSMTLTVYWVQDLAGNETGRVVKGGVIAVDHGAVRATATALDWRTDEAATALLLHWVGHAMGVVNRGIPMLQNHEGEPGHSADRASVMHHQWHQRGAADPVEGAHYLDYPDEVLADWAAAVQDPRVCP